MQNIFQKYQNLLIIALAIITMTTIHHILPSILTSRTIQVEITWGKIGFSLLWIMSGFLLITHRFRSAKKSHLKA